jgi:DNA-binding NarL/FixJ family response regulator
MKKTTVLLADDHMVVREGLRAMLQIEPDIEVVGEAQTGRLAVEQARKLKPDVVVMDIAMPLLNGLEATRQIMEIMPATKVLILSAYSDDEYIERMTRVGAVGYLVKQSSAEVLAKAIREVSLGKTFFSPVVAKRLRNHAEGARGREGKPLKNGANLTSREEEVLQLVAEGAPNKEIASGLSISIKTVEKHRQNLMDKLNIHDTAGLTRHAISTGVIENSVQMRLT